MISVGIGILAALGFGAGWMAHKYRKEKKAAATFKIVEVKKEVREKEDGGGYPDPNKRNGLEMD